MSRKPKTIKPKRTTGCIYRKPGSLTWLAKFSQTVDGQRVRTVKSTGTSDEAEARDILERMVQELGLAPSEKAKKDAKRSGITKAELVAEAMLERVHQKDRKEELEERRRQDLADAVKKEAEEKAAEEARRAEEAARKEADDNALRIADAWEVYEASGRRPDSAAATLAHYEACYKRFAEWMAENHPKVTKLRDVGTDHAEAFIKFVGKTLAAHSHNRVLMVLRLMWRVLRWEKDAQLTIDPWEGLRTKRRRRTRSSTRT